MTNRDAKRIVRLHAAIKEAQHSDMADPRIAGWMRELRIREDRVPRGSQGVTLQLKTPRAR